MHTGRPSKSLVTVRRGYANGGRLSERDIAVYGFPRDLDGHPLLAWMGEDWVSFVAAELLTALRRQDADTVMEAIKCEGRPTLETRADGASGVVNAVSLSVPLQLLLRDSRGRHWRLRGVGAFNGEGLARPEGPTHRVSFEIESSEEL